MKKQFIFVVAIMYTIIVSAQLPTATINVADHVMFPSTHDQIEPSISIDKTRSPNILVSFTTIDGTQNNQANIVGYYYSPSGASPCATICLGDAFNLPNTALSMGHTSTSFDSHGIGYISGIDNDNRSGFFDVSTSDDGITWNSPTTYTSVTFGGDCLGTMATADDMSTSPYAGNYYSVWIDFGPWTHHDGGSGGLDPGSSVDEPWGIIRTERQLNGQTSFGTRVDLTQPFAGDSKVHFANAANVQTGPDGEVYICWADLGDTSALSYPAKNIGFCYSSDGGALYSCSMPLSYLQTISGVSYAALGSFGPGADPNFNNIRVNGNPVMAVDKSCGPHRGWIYMAYAEAAYPDGVSLHSVSQSSFIAMVYSQDHGATWSAPIRISDPSSLFCWSPWIAVDDLTGVVSVVYYQYQGSIANTYTFVAYSNPTNPADWGNIQVSSFHQIMSPLSSANLSGHSGYNPYWPESYEGDYIGIASYGGHAYPVWKDVRSGLRQIWIADVAYDALQLASSTTSQKICPTSSSTTTNPSVISGNINYEAATTIDVATCGSGILSIGSTTNTASVTMTAGKSIEIGPGFTTTSGSVFLAQINESINPCQTPGVIMSKTSSSEVQENSSKVLNINGANISVYPNPTSTQITVDASNGNYQHVSFTVADMSGRVIAHYNNSDIIDGNVKQSIDASSYASGLYIITMTADNQKYSFKFAKE